MKYDDPDMVRTAVRKIRALKQNNYSFSTYQTSFRHILRDLHLDEEVIKDQQYKDLSEELKDSLSLYGSLNGNLEAFIDNCKNLDNRVRARNKEWSGRRGPIFSLAA